MSQLFLNRLEMIQFKNHTSTKIDLQGRLVCIIGDNGMGKTNILDAIYTLAMSKSYISAKQSDIIQENEDFVRLVGQFSKANTSLDVILKYPRRGKKNLSIDGQSYSKLKDHIGTIPVVMITPDDVKLLLGGSADRRSFVDNTICQINPAYLNALSIYNHVLRQKSAMLKSDIVDHDVLDIYDNQMIDSAQVVYEGRKQFFSEFTAVVSKYYAAISDHQEEVKVVYQSQLHDATYAQLLADNRGKETIVQRCLYGIHKDDMELVMSEKPVKSFASQGQRKSLLLALKIAQFDYIRSALQVSPLILLDDLFDKLDHHRVRHLIRILTEGEFGQIFITDTSKTRVSEAISDINISTDWLAIKDGALSKFEHL